MRGTGKGGLIGLIIYLVSLRNEDQLSFDNYKLQVEARAEKFKDRHFSKYLRYRLLKAEVVDEKDAASILQVEENHTIYDLAYTAHRLLNNNNLAGLNSIASRLHLITQVFDPSYLVDNSSSSMAKEISEVFCKKEHLSFSYRKIQKKFRKNPALNFQCLRVIGFCKAALGTSRRYIRKSLAGAYTDALASQMRGTSEIIAYEEFLKINLNFSCLPESAKLYSEASERQLMASTEWPGASMFQIEDIDFVKSISNNIDVSRIDESLCWLVSLQKNKKREFLGEFIEYSESLDCNQVPIPIAISIDIARAYAYFQLQIPSKVSEIVSTLALDKSVKLNNLPIQNFYERFRWKKVAEQANLTQTAIALELFSRTISSAEIESFKKYAIEDLLNNVGKNVPSQLTLEDCGVSIEQFNYFMHILCVQKNMDMLHPLKGSTHLDSERKNILSILATSDKANAAEYNAEILSILHKTRIAQGVALIDRSRVHVDEDPLINKLSVVLYERWNRYKSLEKSEETSFSDITSIMRTISNAEDDSEIFKVPKNESASLLLEIVGIAKDAFLHDIDHGFDRYLGHRVRHNAFANQVRGGLSESHILTKQENGRYSSSEYWSARLENEDLSLKYSAITAMKDFSRDLDDAIHRTKENLLRVTRKGYSEGIFGINVTTKAFYLIERYVSKDSNLSTFISACFQVFWQLLSASLNYAKDYIATVFSAHVGSLFTRLLKEVKTLNLKTSGSLEQAIVQAKNETSKAIDQAATWFSKNANDENSHIYSVKDASDIVVEACVSSHKGADPVVNLQANGNIDIHPPALYQLSDILWIIIDNACTHGGHDRGVSIDISLQAFSEKDSLIISTKNIINDVQAESLAKANLAAIKSDIDQKKYYEKLMVEGKSGLKKLAAMSLRYPNGKLDFKIVESVFHLNLSIPLVAVYMPEKVKS